MKRNIGNDLRVYSIEHLDHLRSMYETVWCAYFRGSQSNDERIISGEVDSPSPLYEGSSREEAMAAIRRHAVAAGLEEIHLRTFFSAWTDDVSEEQCMVVLRGEATEEGTPLVYTVRRDDDGTYSIVDDLDGSTFISGVGELDVALQEASCLSDADAEAGRRE